MAVIALGLPTRTGQPAIEGAEGGLAAAKAHDREAEHGRGAIGRGLGLGAEPAPAGDPVLGGEGEAGGEVVFGGPPGHVRADLGDQLEAL